MSRQPHDEKTCPLCDEPMRLVTRKVVDHVPGTKHSTECTLREWICSNCDHYEEADEGDVSS